MFDYFQEFEISRPTNISFAQSFSSCLMYSFIIYANVSVQIVRFEFLKAVKMSVLILRIVRPCRLVSGYQRIGGTYCLHRQKSFKVNLFERQDASQNGKCTFSIQPELADVSNT
jgi:hypothetical protein